MAAREAALGPDHVDVAESLSNLAILYNQKGDMAKALPMYERALHIWEAQKGPEHPEVAHTLTDLAVLHLEQVGVVLPFICSNICGSFGGAQSLWVCSVIQFLRCLLLFWGSTVSEAQGESRHPGNARMLSDADVLPGP